MPEYTERITQRLSIPAAVGDPALVDDNTKDSGWVDMSKFRRAAFLLLVGATDITVDFKLQSATASDGTGAADINGKAITQFAATDDNKQAIIEITAAEVAALGATRRYVRARATIGNGATGAYVAVVPLADNDRYVPASADNVASVAQIVA